MLLLHVHLLPRQSLALVYWSQGVRCQPSEQQQWQHGSGMAIEAAAVRTWPAGRSPAAAPAPHWRQPASTAGRRGGPCSAPAQRAPRCRSAPRAARRRAAARQLAAYGDMRGDYVVMRPHSGRTHGRWVSAGEAHHTSHSVARHGPMCTGTAAATPACSLSPFLEGGPVRAVNGDEERPAGAAGPRAAGPVHQQLQHAATWRQLRALRAVLGCYAACCSAGTSRCRCCFGL
jgi:hypothetical protein